MNNSIIEIAQLITKGFEVNFEKMIIEKKDISEFVIEVKKMLDTAGNILIAEALETMDLMVRTDVRRKQNRHVKEKAAPNIYATLFREVHYHRNYYKNKHKNEYSYLSDEIVGIRPYDKMYVSLKARLIEEAIETPYARSGKKATEKLEISSQSVMNSIREIGWIENHAVEIVKTKNTTKVIYIEADEEHVALQTGGCAEPKLIYVHEGKRLVGKDGCELFRPRYFGGMYRGPEPEDLWTEVADYLDQAYDYEKIDQLYGYVTSYS